MNAQEVFDKVVAHLRKQGAQAMSEDGESCLYRTPEGLKCAVGCLIPDEEYDPSLESWNIFNIAKNQKLSGATRDMLLQHEALLYALQQVHDHSPIEKWEIKFQDIARNAGLVYPMVGDSP